MPFDDVLVHTATPWVTVEAGELVDGDTDAEERPGTPFDCCLFLPQGAEESGTPRGGSRQVKRPTLLVAAEDRTGAPVSLAKEAELDIVAPELNAASGLPSETAVRYQVDGSPQPLGRPGDDIIGFQAQVKRVED